MKPTICNILWVLTLIISIFKVHSQANPPYYDGKACASNADCISNSCSANICGKKLKITAISKNDDRTLIQTSYSETFGSPGIFGVVVNEYDISMKGKIRTIYKFPSGDNILMHKFTYLNFRQDVTTKAKGVGVCFYQALKQKFEDNTVRCAIIGTSDVTSGSNVISTPSQSGVRTNLALGKVASQSSNYNNGGVASKAVDGNTFAQYNYLDQVLNTVTHTESEFNPWWRVDLGAQTIVRQIEIYKRLDGYNGRLFDFSVSGLKSNDSVVYHESWETTPPQCSGTIVTSCSTDDIIYIVIPRTIAPIRHIKITLNGAVERVLCLAEVVVYGISYDFQIPFGKLSNLPPTNVDRIVFFQDNDVGSATNTIKSITVEEGPDEPVFSAGFLLISGVSDLNIQGVRTITRSNNGAYIAMKDINNEKRILVYVDAKILIFNDPFAANSIALSDNGYMIVSFESSSQGFVRLLRIESRNIANKDEKIGVAQFGSGVSITPDGSRAAVGSPRAAKVYIYGINPETAEFQSNVDVIEVPSSLSSIYSGSDFGAKIALSETGNTIAIAAPKYKEDGTEIGAVFLYTKSESGWIFQNIVKGSVSNPQYGVSGLAINDSSGRLDVTDFRGDISNLKFDVVCNSMYASSIGKNNNYFVPECRCEAGYKTYEGGRVIINPKDVCLPCANRNAPECNDDNVGPPGTQLTSPPTMTSWSENPSLAPTINKSPSASPSSSPSFSLRSQYDGDACRFDNECFIGSCNNDAQCDSVPPVSSQCYKCESTPFQLRDNEADVTAIVDSFGSSIGGIIVSRSQPNQMDIYESAQKRMKLSTRVLISTGTRVYVNFDPTDSPSTGLRICFFESAGLVNFDENEARCIDLTATQNAVFSLNSAFNGKTTYIQYIGISQDSGHTKIKEIRFASEGGLKNPDGTCVDTNAFLENSECYCRQGFVTVNGDPKKQLKIVGGVVDVCVSCLETLSCKFDGDACLDDGSCYRDVRDSPCDSLSKKCDAQDLQISTNSASDLTASLVEGNYSNSTGGVISYASEISIFGDTYKVFRTNRMLSVSRFTQVKFTALKGEPSSTGLLQICFFLQNETSFSEDLMSLSSFEKRCFEVAQLSTLAKSFVINIGEDLFNNRMVDDLNYIGFQQSESLDSRADTVTIKDLRIDLSDSIDFIDSNGRCVDENRDSDLPFSLSPGACMCKSGYVNSNGGKFITSNDDKCVPCLEPCGFDGDNCTYTTDCFSGVCGLTNTCEAPSLILKYKGNEYKNIELNPLLGSSTRGNGIFVTQNAQKSQLIELEGNVFKVYEVTGDPIAINKFTKIRFDSNKRPSTNVLKLCMYDSSSAFECEKYCHSITGQGFQTNEIFASELFASRKVNISHIAFEQACSDCVQYERSFISNLQFLEGTVTDSYKDGKCTDVNAVVVASNNELVCKCSDGFISSSGRKLLDNEDSCVKCVGGLACNAREIADDVVCFSDLNVYLRFGGLQSDPTVANARYSEDFLTGLSFSGGGVEIYSLNSLTSNSLSLVGKMAKVFSLQVPYTVETFSRLLLDFVPHDADGDQLFVSICFQQLASSTRDSSVQCYALEWTYLPQMSWNYVTNPLLKLNVALGKTAIQSTTDGLNVASNAVDGSSTFDVENEASNKVTLTELENFPYWEVDLAGEYVIDQVVIYFIPDPELDVLKDYNVLFFDRRNQISFNYYGDATLEDPIQIINIPLNVIASKVRVVLNMMDGNARILSLVEVEIFQRLSKATKKIDIPLGNLNNGFVIDRIAFVQTGNNVNMVSNLSNITFIYGSAPEITDAPSISPAPTLSLQPSITSSPTPLNSTTTPLPTTITESPSSSATFGST